MTRLTHAIVAASLLTIVGSATFAQSILRVDDDAPPGGNGSSWASAYRDLQDALDAAATLANQGQFVEVRVAAGTYRPDRGTNNRMLSFHMRNRVSIVGGYLGAGGGDAERNPDPLTNGTYLSGEITGQNAEHVVRANGVNDTAVLDGVTIEDGDGSSLNEREGGGLRISGGNPIIRASVIRDCYSQDRGGGVATLGTATPLFDRVVFQSNRTFGTRGGGIYAEGAPRFVGCVFAGNSASDHPGRGGAAYLAGSVEFTDCNFSSNHVVSNTGPSDGGGAYCLGGSVRFVRCTFASHSAGYRTSHGAAISATNTLLTIDQCTFTANAIGSGGGGGAVYLNGGSMVVTRSMFHRNSAGGSGKAGGVVSGGAIQVGSGNAVIDRCTFTNNRATNISGGAISAAAGTTTIRNCAFSGNHASGNVLGTLGSGGAISTGANNSIVNCTFSGNRANGRAGGIGGASGLTIRNCVFWRNDANGGQMNETAQLDVTAPVLSYSVVQGLTGAYGGVGNIDADPTLVRNPDPGPDGQWTTADDDYGDLHLLPGSPAIDAGDNAALSPATLRDLGNNWRYIDDPTTPDTGPGFGPRIDLGPYEFQLGHPRGDLNCDSLVNFFDIDPFILALFDAPNYATAYPNCNLANANTNGDTAIDLFDIDGFLTLLFDPG